MSNYPRKQLHKLKAKARLERKHKTTMNIEKEIENPNKTANIDEVLDPIVQTPDDVCTTCGGTGEVSKDEMDRDGNWQRGVGSAPCPDCTPSEPADFSGATEGDR